MGGLRSRLTGEALAWAQELLSKLREDHFVEQGGNEKNRTTPEALRGLE